MRPRCSRFRLRGRRSRGRTGAALVPGALPAPVLLASQAGRRTRPWDHGGFVLRTVGRRLGSRALPPCARSMLGRHPSGGSHSASPLTSPALAAGRRRSRRSRVISQRSERGMLRRWPWAGRLRSSARLGARVTCPLSGVERSPGEVRHARPRTGRTSVARVPSPVPTATGSLGTSKVAATRPDRGSYRLWWRSRGLTVCRSVSGGGPPWPAPPVVVVSSARSAPARSLRGGRARFT